MGWCEAVEIETTYEVSLSRTKRYLRRTLLLPRAVLFTVAALLCWLTAATADAGAVAVLVLVLAGLLLAATAAFWDYALTPIAQRDSGRRTIRFTDDALTLLTGAETHAVQWHAVRRARLHHGWLEFDSNGLHPVYRLPVDALAPDAYAEVTAWLRARKLLAS